jgi:hypothetical protein
MIVRTGKFKRKTLLLFIRLNQCGEKIHGSRSPTNDLYRIVSDTEKDNKLDFVSTGKYTSFKKFSLCDKKGRLPSLFFRVVNYKFFGPLI